MTTTPIFVPILGQVAGVAAPVSLQPGSSTSVLAPLLRAAPVSFTPPAGGGGGTSQLPARYARLQRMAAGLFDEPAFEGLDRRPRRTVGAQAQPVPSNTLPGRNKRLLTLLQQHHAAEEFFGRAAPRRTAGGNAAPVNPATVSTRNKRLLTAIQNFFLEDEFSGRTAPRGGAPAPFVPPASLPFAAQRRLLVILGAYFPDEEFQGRTAPRATYIPSAAPAPPAPFPASRLRKIMETHFREEEFQGVQRRGVNLNAAHYPPIFPSDRTARLLRLIQAHFPDEVYEGRRIPHPWDKSFGGGSNNPRRASQIVIEALGRGTEPPVRASQIVAESLVQDRAGARASQIVYEALYQQHLPSYVRASQIVVEVLVPYMELPVIPVYPQLNALTFDYKKRVKSSVLRGVSTSGREVGVGLWANPQWEWDLSYDVLADTGQNVGTTTSDIRTLIGFFLWAQGTLNPFYFLDPDDNTVTSQAIGIGDGFTTNFTFSRTYGLDSSLGDFVGTEPVGGVNTAATLNIYVAGVLQTTGFTINAGTPYGNFVQFATAPAPNAVISADFSFWYFCRLKDDQNEFAKFMNGMWELKTITLYSLKN